MKSDYTIDASYLEGAGEALEAISPEFSKRLLEAARLLEQAGKHMCGQGFFGCRGGDKCTSDHK